MDVEEWLEGLGLAQYAAAFAENDIDFTILGKLIDADLKELGISSLGHRKRLLAAIAERGVTAAPSPRHADGSPAVDESGIAAHQLADLFGIEGSRYFSESQRSANSMVTCRRSPAAEYCVVGPGQTLLSDGVYRALSGRSVCDAARRIQLKGFEAFEPPRA